MPFFFVAWSAPGLTRLARWAPGDGLSACPLPSLRIGRAAGQHLDPPVVRTNRG